MRSKAGFREGEAMTALLAKVDEEAKAANEIAAYAGNRIGRVLEIGKISDKAGEALMAVAKELADHAMANAIAADKGSALLRQEAEDFAADVLRGAENIARRINSHLDRCQQAQQALRQHREAIIDAATAVGVDTARAQLPEEP